MLVQLIFLLGEDLQDVARSAAVRFVDKIQIRTDYSLHNGDGGAFVFGAVGDFQDFRVLLRRDFQAVDKLIGTGPVMALLFFLVLEFHLFDGAIRNGGTGDEANVGGHEVLPLVAMARQGIPERVDQDGGPGFVHKVPRGVIDGP